MTVARPRRRGFSLVEALGAMFALGVSLALGGALLVMALRIDRVSSSGANRLAQRSELADAFRADVSRSFAAPERLAEFQAGPACLILQRPDGGHVLYLWLDDALERVERSGGREHRRPLPAARRGGSVEFARAGGLLTLRLTDPPLHGVARTTEITAALGGDLR